MPWQQTDAEALQSIREVFDDDASLAKYYALLVEYAQEKGGLTLQFWRTHLGAAFADESVKPTVRTLEETAALLNLPVLSLQRILTETVEVIRSKWLASPEFAAQGKSADELTIPMIRDEPTDSPPEDPTLGGH